jgi:hypothetical protein
MIKASRKEQSVDRGFHWISCANRAFIGTVTRGDGEPRQKRRRRLRHDGHYLVNRQPRRVLIGVEPGPSVKFQYPSDLPTEFSNRLGSRWSLIGIHSKLDFAR